MKKRYIFIIAAMFFVFTGCDSGDGDPTEESIVKVTANEEEEITTSPTVTEEDPVAVVQSSDVLRGEWMYVHSGEIVYIDENFDADITQIDDRLISVEKDSKTYHMIRRGIDTTSVSGSLYEESSITASPSLRAQNRIGNINVILQHITDENNKKEEDLDATGDFDFSNVKSGTYTLKATTDTNLSVETEVDVYGEEVSLGSFKLVGDDGYNFKTEFIIDNSDNGYFYGTMKTYTGKLVVNNIGSKKGTGLNYTFKTDDGFVADFSNEIVLGTVEAGSSIEIPFSITFNILNVTTHTVPVDVIIRDANANEWSDTVFFHVFQTPLDINIATKESNIKGYIIIPGHDLVQIDTSNASVKIPYREGKQYYIVLSNPNIDNETPYSIGVDVPSLNFDTFQDTSAHEPNGKESDAKTLMLGDSIISYLHEGDIDYFIVDMSSDADVGSFSPPQIPFR